MGEHAFGEPVKLLKSVDGQYIIDQPELDHILNHAEVRDRKIVVFSIIGPQKKGKSFFMNYCLRFMYANVRISSIK